MQQLTNVHEKKSSMMVIKLNFDCEISFDTCTYFLKKGIAKIGKTLIGYFFTNLSL